MTNSEKHKANVKDATELHEDLALETYYGLNFKCELLDLRKSDPELYDKLKRFVAAVKDRR